MNVRHRVHAALPCALALALALRPAAAQSTAALVRALDLESRGRPAEAAVAFRAALGTRDMIPALLGLERAYSELGRTDSLVAIVDSIGRAHPTEALVQNVRLRTLITARRDAQANAAFREWVRATPNNVAPYRDYAGLLLDAGRLAQADSVLRSAIADGQGRRGVAVMLGRLNAARSSWTAAASAWRAGVEEEPYQVQAAVFALAPAEDASRDAVRSILGAPPVRRRPREVLAGLELGWGAPAAAWNALSELSPDTGAVASWLEFAERADGIEAWIPAREAWRAVLRTKCDPDVALRAADASIRGGDPSTALVVLDNRSCPADGGTRRRTAVALRVRALALAGRAEEASTVLAASGDVLEQSQREALASAIAWGWVRKGDITRARVTMGSALEDDTTGVLGWLALYEGDLATARRTLRASGAPSRDAVGALALLSRTRADRAPGVGRSFLLLARGDSAAAAAAMESASNELADATPVLLMLAARIHIARGDVVRAEPLWRRIVEGYEQSPEAAEADLSWAKSLASRGDTAGARTRLEHLILTYPSSALVPQARRALDQIGGTT
jgi:tetratricopeptide (TPR) repeat protein